MDESVAALRLQELGVLADYALARRILARTRLPQPLVVAAVGESHEPLVCTRNAQVARHTNRRNVVRSIALGVGRTLDAARALRASGALGVGRVALGVGRTTSASARALRASGALGVGRVTVGAHRHQKERRGARRGTRGGSRVLGGSGGRGAAGICSTTFAELPRSPGLHGLVPLLLHEQHDLGLLPEDVRLVLAIPKQPYAI
jgi:hypothetical protein